MTSVIIPIFNEAKSTLLPKILELLSSNKNIEIICVDSSSDGTTGLLERYPVKIVKYATNSRAKRLNKCLEYASNNLILSHHPHTILSLTALEYLALQKYLWVI